MFYNTSDGDGEVCKWRVWVINYNELYKKFFWSTNEGVIYLALVFVGIVSLMSGIWNDLEGLGEFLE